MPNVGRNKRPVDSQVGLRVNRFQRCEHEDCAMMSVNSSFDRLSRRGFLGLAGTACLGPMPNLVRRSVAAGSASAVRPNIIFILSDDLAQSDLGCYGQKLIRTPRLGRMAFCLCRTSGEVPPPGGSTSTGNCTSSSRSRLVPFSFIRIHERIIVKETRLNTRLVLNRYSGSLYKSLKSSMSEFLRRAYGIGQELTLALEGHRP